MTDESGRMPWFLRWYTLPAYAPLAIAGISEAVEMCQKYGLERIVSEFNQIPGALGVVVYGGGGIVAVGGALVALNDCYQQIKKKILKVR